MISFRDYIKKVKTTKQLAKKHKVNHSIIKQQLNTGIKVEKEHTNLKALARKIALAHLDELPDYYSRLKKIEK